jgi:hypothetical protein
MYMRMQAEDNHMQQQSNTLHYKHKRGLMQSVATTKTNPSPAVARAAWRQYLNNQHTHAAGKPHSGPE